MKKIKTMYYRFWVGAILNTKEYKKKEKGWEYGIFIICTLANALNLYSIDALLILFKIKSNITLSFFSDKKLNSAVSFIIEFALVFIILNYFLVFYKKRYIKLIAKYEGMSGVSVATYGAISTIIAFVLTILDGIFY